MSGTVIATYPNDPAVLSGESLGVRTVIDNRGSERVDAPSANAQPPFLYVLRSRQQGGPVYGLSAEATIRRRSPGRVGPPALVIEPLPGGAKREFQDDIGAFWNEGFEPQKYWLTVRYEPGGLESPNAPVTVLPLDVESISSFVSENHLATIIAHRRQDGQITVLQRESEPRDPREGVFVRRQLLSKGGPVSVATTIDVAPAGNGRWFAWLRDGSLVACSAWGNRVDVVTKPVPAGNVLLSPGFQIALGTALFGTVSADGRLDTYQAAPSTELHRRWSALLGANVGKVLWNAQADGSINVAWEETSSGRIMRQSFAADGKPRNTNPQALTPGRPIAWGMPPSGAPVVWALIGDETRLVVGRIPVSGDRVVTQLPLLREASEWAFYETAEGNSALAAIARGKLMSTRLDAPSWKAARDAPEARELHLVSLSGRTLWAEWVERGFGIRRCKLE